MELTEEYPAIEAAMKSIQVRLQLSSHLPQRNKRSIYSRARRLAGFPPINLHIAAEPLSQLSELLSPSQSSQLEFKNRISQQVSADPLIINQFNLKTQNLVKAYFFWLLYQTCKKKVQIRLAMRRDLVQLQSRGLTHNHVSICSHMNTSSSEEYKQRLAQVCKRLGKPAVAMLSHRNRNRLLLLRCWKALVENACRLSSMETLEDEFSSDNDNLS